MTNKTIMIIGITNKAMLKLDYIAKSIDHIGFYDWKMLQMRRAVGTGYLADVANIKYNA